MSNSLTNLQVGGPVTNGLSMWPYNSPAVTPIMKTKLASALVKTQLEMGDATKGAKNPFFKSNYADLNSIREAVLPAANTNGLVVLQPTVTVDGIDYVRTLVIHESGEEMFSDTKIVAVKQNDPQAYGSAISYARRYGLQAFFNIGAVDDDGEKAMGRSAPPAAPAKAAPAAKSVAAASPAAPVVEVSAPVANPGTASVVAATEAPKAPSTSFRPKKSEPVSAPVVEAAAEDQDWS
jgi:hypothetical protein